MKNKWLELRCLNKLNRKICILYAQLHYSQAKLYEMATEKIENGHFVKRQLKELQDEAKLL